MGEKRGKYITKPEGGMSHAAIGAEMGISSQRVKQIEVAALRKLREQFPELRYFCDDAARVDSIIYQ